MESPSEVFEQGYLQQLKAVYDRMHVSATMIATSMILANTVAGNDFVVRADDPILKQAELALPSALVAPNMGDYDKAAGVGSQIIITAIGADCAGRTSAPSEMLGTAVAAQIGSSGADAIVERTGWLTHAERTQEDVGASAVYVAWIMKFMLDREKTSESHKQGWRLAIGALAVGAVVVIPLAEGSQGGGKLDAVAHGVSLIIGYGAHKLGQRRKLPQGRLSILKEAN